MNIWQNYFLTALRSLRRNKINTALALGGLVISFVASFAILQYVKYEKGYDDFHEHVDRTYRVSHLMTNASGTTKNALTFFAAKDEFKESIPEIETATHMLSVNNVILKIGERLLKQEDVLITTPDFFDIFSIDLLSGSPKDLEAPDVIFLSRRVADKLFPNGAEGEVLEVEGLFGQTWQARVAGVFEDIPNNSHLVGEVLLPRSKLVSFGREGILFGPNLSFDQVVWRWLSFHTYVRLEEDAAIGTVEKKANAIVAEFRESINQQLQQKHEVWLQPLASIHTTPGSEMEMSPVNSRQIIDLFLVIAFGILIIGWINYINLSTARSISRSKEVGIRKALGSNKLQLKIQFQLEALLLNLLAVALSIGLLVLVVPFLQEIAAEPFFDGAFSDTRWLLGLAGTIVLGSLLAGFYPSQVLSSYDTKEVIKGKIRHTGSGIFLRRGLVILQFVFTIFLIGGVLIVHNQMMFMMHHELGVEIDQRVIIDSPGNEFGREDFRERMNTLTNEIRQIAGVEAVSVGSMVPGVENFWRNSTEDDRSDRAGLFIHRAIVDENYVDLYGLEMIAGRSLNKSFGAEESAILLNRNSTVLLGYENAEDAVGEQITFAGQTFDIVGVVADFYQRGVQFAVEPMSFSLDTGLAGNYISVKAQAADWALLTRELEDQYKTFFPDSPYEARFLDDVFNGQYENERRFRTLFSLFSVIALLVAMLGILGLASYLLNQKLREVCIRKVLGARLDMLFLQLNKEYFVLSILSFLVASPLIWLAMQHWLEGFANRISVGPVYFIVPLLVVLLIVLLTTIYQTTKVVLTNPTDVLKEDG